MKRLYEPSAYDANIPVGSFWQDSGVSPLEFAPLRSEIDTDFAVVGGGFTGMNAALQLVEKYHANVVLVDAVQPGWGASGRNGGFACLGGSKLSKQAQIKRFGLPEAQAYHHHEIMAIDRVRDNLDRYAIQADTHSKGELCLAHNPRAFTQMQQDAEFERLHFDQPSEIIPKAALGERGMGGNGFFGGLHLPQGFALNPLKYAQGLATALKTSDAQVFGSSPVTSLQSHPKGITLKTPQGQINAKKIIISTNGYGSDDIPSGLGGRFLPLLSSILVTRPITADEQAAQGWTTDLMSYDSRNLLHYFRLMPNGRLLFGQRGAVRHNDAALNAVRRRNRQDFDAMFPAFKHIETTHFWSGLICTTRNMHPFVGPINGTPGAFAAFGYHGNGVAMGSHSGRLIGDLAAGAAPQLPALMTTDLRRFPLPGLRRTYLGAAFLGYRIQDRFF